MKKQGIYRKSVVQKRKFPQVLIFQYLYQGLQLTQVILTLVNSKSNTSRLTHMLRKINNIIIFDK